MDESTLKTEYDRLISLSYSHNDIEVYFMVKYNININKYEFVNKRIGQAEFRNNLINRFQRCIITNSEIFDACHIVPFSSSSNMDVNNGMLLNKCHHDYYDKYFWSINPYTYQIEINYNLVDPGDYFIQILLKTDLQFLRNYPLMNPYLIQHYESYLIK
jgi:hypothetical protein